MVFTEIGPVELKGVSEPSSSTRPTAKWSTIETTRAAIRGHPVDLDRNSTEREKISWVSAPEFSFGPSNRVSRFCWPGRADGVSVGARPGGRWRCGPQAFARMSISRIATIA